MVNLVSQIYKRSISSLKVKKVGPFSMFSPNLE